MNIFKGKDGTADQPSKQQALFDKIIYLFDPLRKIQMVNEEQHHISEIEERTDMSLRFQKINSFHSEVYDFGKMLSVFAIKDRMKIERLEAENEQLKIENRNLRNSFDNPNI